MLFLHPKTCQNFDFSRAVDITNILAIPNFLAFKSTYTKLTMSIYAYFALPCTFWTWRHQSLSQYNSEFCRYIGWSGRVLLRNAPSSW